MVKCPECGAGADLTKDGSYAHCASCMCPTTDVHAFNVQIFDADTDEL